VEEGRKQVVFIHPIYWLTALYTTRRKRGSREISGR
jgi:hypothetical protein